MPDTPTILLALAAVLAAIGAFFTSAARLIRAVRHPTPMSTLEIRRANRTIVRIQVSDEAIRQAVQLLALLLSAFLT